MKAIANGHFVGKSVKSKTGKFKYGLIVTDEDIRRNLAADFAYVEFWSAEDLKIDMKPRQVKLDMQVYGENVVYKFLGLAD